MNLETNDQTLLISGLRELTAGTSSDVKTQARLRFTDDLKNIDFDCQSVEFLDSSGLGTLISIQKMVNERGGKFRLLKPRSTIIQVLEMTRLHRVFDIVA